MAIGRETNYGRQWRLSVSLIGARPGGTNGELGLALNGASKPSFWIVLLNSGYNFVAELSGPNPDHDTVAALGGTNVITPTGNYQDNDVPREIGRMTTAVDNGLNQGLLAFIAGQQPLILVTAAGGLTNVAGFAVCAGNGGSSDKVHGIYPFTDIIASVPVNSRIQINDLILISASS